MFSSGSDLQILFASTPISQIFLTLFNCKFSTEEVYIYIYIYIYTYV